MSLERESTKVGGPAAGRMLSVGTFSPFDSVTLLPPNKSNFYLNGTLLPFSSKNAPTGSSSQQTHLCFKTRDNGLPFLGASALNSKRRNGGTQVVETVQTDGSDFDENVDEDEDSDVEFFLPFGKMKMWLENKPRGFGEGKVYDTSIEEKLLQEIEQSRQAQIANINKLKDDPVKTSTKKDERKKKAPEDIPSGILVRLSNLPKKKNVHRDLKSAFEGVPGIIHISPAVSGSKKTKDPLCKGFAFVDFESEEHATRFVQLFSGQSIAFGKVQKQIRCEIMNPRSHKTVDKHSADNTHCDPKLTVTGLKEDPVADFNENENSVDGGMEAASDGSVPDDELDLAELEGVRDNLEFVSVSELNVSDKTKQAKKSATDSFSTNQRKKVQAIEKKLIAKGKVPKVPKFDIAGSAKRLKIKEKSVLTDVFSKYAVKGTSTSKEES